MKHILLILTITICCKGIPLKYRIHGGQNAISGQFPFMVALNQYDYQYCNGVILTPSWILTIASCLQSTPPDAEVYVGNHVNQVNGTAYRFFERVTHKEYDQWTLQGDIALIRIKAVLEYSDTIQPIELGGSPAPNSTCTILGWGSTESEDFPTLQYVETTTIDLDLCQDFSLSAVDDRYLGPEQVCTLSSTNVDACYRDRGGALVCDGKLSGLFSYGIGVGCEVGVPNVFTNVASYSDWILSYIKA